MAHSPTVSVIIPAYNRAEMLAEAIESVLRQTAAPHEIVVVDDGSIDVTPDVLNAFGNSISNFKAIRIDHTPLVGRVRNAGVANSTGSILAFLDSDDLWMPNRIERQLLAWTQMPGAQLAFCNLHSFDENGLIPEGPYLPPNRNYYGRILAELLMEPVIVPSTMMVTREVFDRFGPFTDGLIEEDYEFLLEVAAHGDVCYVPDVLVLMRDHSAGRARSRRELADTEYLNIVRRFLARHPEISREERVCARQGMANVHLKLARFYLETGNRREARRHWAAMARMRPWDRRLPGAFAEVMLTPPIRGVVSSRKA
jgi:glycosyltransferase involved in cell wall biosynthesis